MTPPALTSSVQEGACRVFQSWIWGRARSSLEFGFSTVPHCPLLTRFPRLPEAGRQLHRPKGGWHSSAGPDPAALASCLSWGGEVKLWLGIQGCSGSAVVAQGWPECRCCRAGSKQSLALLPLAGLWCHCHNSSTTPRPSGAASVGLARWELWASISWLLFHSIHSDSPTASQPSTATGHCSFWCWK